MGRTIMFNIRVISFAFVLFSGCNVQNDENFIEEVVKLKLCENSITYSGRSPLPNGGLESENAFYVEIPDSCWQFFSQQVVDKVGFDCFVAGKPCTWKNASGDTRLIELLSFSPRSDVINADAKLNAVKVVYVYAAE